MTKNANICIMFLGAMVLTAAHPIWAAAGVDTASTQTSTDTASSPLILARPAINYTGASLSALIPGSGQIYQRRYFMGGLFLITEASVIAFSSYWWGEADWRRTETARFRDSSFVIGMRGEAAGDSALAYRAGWYSVIADRSEFEARSDRNTAYSALVLALGIHLYNFLDALEAGGAAPTGAEKNPSTAGLLAAVPLLGLGQIYNERPGKAGLIITAQTSLALTAYNHHRQMNFASDKYNQMRDTSSVQYQYRAEYLGYWKGRYDDAFSRRNTYLWITLAVYLYSIFDAVVDAHLSDYDNKINIGTDLAAGIGGWGADGVSVSLTVNLGSKRR